MNFACFFFDAAIRKVKITHVTCIKCLLDRGALEQFLRIPHRWPSMPGGQMVLLSLGPDIDLQQWLS